MIERVARNFPSSNRLSHLLQYELLGKAVLRFERWRDERKIRSLRPRDDNPLNPPLVCVARMKELMARHYLEGRHAAGVKKVAWVTSGAPSEILKALDFFLIYPENHAALCGVRRKAEEICTQAENEGYSRDLCSYARTDIGTVLSGKTPVGRLPKPDLLLCCTNICQTVLYWYRVLAEYFQVPLLLIDTPFLYEEAQPHQVDYVKRQLEEMIPVAERVAGRELSEQRLMQVVDRARVAAELWLEILNRSQHRPAPMTAFDGFIHMGPIVDLRGDEETVLYYESVLAELDARIAKGIGAIKNERFRVLWDNLPIWFQIGNLSKVLARRGVNVVASTYTYAWGELAPLIDPSKGLDSMARVYLHPILNRSTGDKLRSMRRMVEEFHLHGVILHSDRSCKPYSLGQMDQRERLVNEVGIPAVLLEADHSDPRSYADKQGEARLEAFMETMEARA
jgi:benzoyl-CoA reductase/2-hydroxyglutaryl-CoA dehydratase subunit BcrC/BadD/HgdB